jgi:hypothetical protein
MLITVITPTTGKESLGRLIESIDSQSKGRVFHLLLWDDKRDSDLNPESFNSASRHSIVAPNGSGRNQDAPGSILRAAGLMLARTPWVTFADDDVWWDKNHLDMIELLMNSCNWLSVLRRIYKPPNCELIGIDRFESVGDDVCRKVPYEMCDGNTMAFKREFGVGAAYLFRETVAYNDDRLLYGFLKQYAGPRGKTNQASINQICPDKLINFFVNYCDK